MDENATPIQPTNQQKQPRTADSIRKSIENELADNRLKEAKGKLKNVIVELAAAKKVVEGKEAEIAALFEEYSDVIQPPAA